MPTPYPTSSWSGVGASNLFWACVANPNWFVGSQVDVDPALVAGLANRLGSIIESPAVAPWQGRPTDLMKGAPSFKPPPR